MTEKVKVAVFDNTLKIELNKYPIAENGKQIQIVSGGAGHWMPQFDNDCALEFPKKTFGGRWKSGTEKVYFVPKMGKKCINFKTGEVTGPDIEQIKQSLGALMLDQLGQEKPQLPSWIPFAIFFLVLVNVFIALKVFGVMR